MVERFMAKVEIVPFSGCWIWMGHVTYNGYGQFRKDSKAQYAHRVAYELFRGIVPEGLNLDHLCRVRCCVNPHHLEPVTHLENVRRGESGIWMKARTHCPQGHEYTPENTYIWRGRRACKRCNRIYGLKVNRDTRRKQKENR